LGKGSEFIVRLPVRTAEGAPREKVSLGHPSTFRIPQRVLVVDDNHDAADSLGMLLRFEGADVQVVYDGASALRALETYQPKIVLVDLGMPGMDGFEVALKVRENPEFKDLMIVALTGWGQEQDRARSREAGFDHHLIKPADLNALRALLASAEKTAA
jgi:CheY-like chemotaxis protein